MRGTGRVWKTLVFLATMAILVYTAGWLSTALAQYPPPAGTVTGGSDTATAPIDESVELTCTVLDTAGAPVADAPCTFTIVAQPGTDASIGSLSVTKLTDANGVATATLYAGTAAGVIVVEVEAQGLTSLVVVTAGAEPGIAPPTEPSGVPPQLPATGGGGIAGISDDAATKGALVMAALATAAIIATGGAYILLRRGKVR
jgi:hypothetical protein